MFSEAGMWLNVEVNAAVTPCCFLLCGCIIVISAVTLMAKSSPLASPEPEEDDIAMTETQFVPQSGDEDVLWEVIEVTAEKDKKYKVRWKGLDPTTGRPWAQVSYWMFDLCVHDHRVFIQSWVPKKDVTSDLSAEWKAKQAAKRQRQESRKGI